ncbi:hypothetical protein PINS_up012600 [Pythium insidiosum]|nr:hypothetical protein PINS_up012600 [Pythium insidiosum]
MRSTRRSLSAIDHWRTGGRCAWRRRRVLRHGAACAANETGACPYPQDGLEFGSFCAEIKVGVLGCKPYSSVGEWNAAHHYGDEMDEGDVMCAIYEGERPMSVEGVEGVFCVRGQACAGVQGACPEPQVGLEFGAYCGTVQSGVLGCKPYDSLEAWQLDHPETLPPPTF